MGTTYSIFEDIPPSITHLTMQKQSMSIEVRLIVFYIDIKDKNIKAIKNYNKYSILISKLNAKGFIVITVNKNLDSSKIITDPNGNLIQAISNKIIQIKNKYIQKSINIEIQSITFLAHGESCDNLLKVFDCTNRFNDKAEIYNKIKYDRKSISLNNFNKNIGLLILIDPTADKLFERKIIQINKKIQIIFTDPVELDSKNIKNNLKSLDDCCTGRIKADRIKNVKSSDITLRFKHNICEKTSKHQKNNIIVEHLINSIYDNLE
jgi:hypothetical protein